MQETAKVNYVQYGKGSKSKKCKPRPNGSSVDAEEHSGSNVNAGEPKIQGKEAPTTYKHLLEMWESMTQERPDLQGT